ncbi:MAG: 50S ribosomal protein L10 [Parachlamydiales bacterium]
MRQEKQLLLEEIEGLLKGSDTFLVTRYERLTADKAGVFRNRVRNSGGQFEVVRKRILLKAAQAAKVSLSEEILKGHIGIVIAGEDPVATTKVVFEVGKEFEEAVQVMGGQFQGTPYSAKEIEAISKLPSLDEMRAQLLSLLVAPMSQTLGVMDALLASLPHLLRNKSEAGQS